MSQFETLMTIEQLEDYKLWRDSRENIDIHFFCCYFKQFIFPNHLDVDSVVKENDRVSILSVRKHEIPSGTVEMFIRTITVTDEMWLEYLKKDPITVKNLRKEKLKQIYEQN